MKNQRRGEREALGLSQAEAARRAGISMATWRRWEEDPSQVRPSTRAMCEKVLTRHNREATQSRESKALATRFEKAWAECPYLTPRQAMALSLTLAWWADMELGEWLKDPGQQPLHEVGPLDAVNPRVMILVGENRAWAEMLRRRCIAVSDELEAGVLPFDRPGCFADELLMALALGPAEDSLNDMPEVFDDVTPRLGSRSDGGADDVEGTWVMDDEWDLVSDAFDDRCRWDEWEVPMKTNHPLLPQILADNHPHTWFDPGQGSGQNYLRQLAGLAVTNNPKETPMPKQHPDDFESQWLTNDENRARFEQYLNDQHPSTGGARQADMPVWPYPAPGNVAVEYLVNRAIEEFETNGDARAAIVWGVVHSWFEASIAAESDRLQGKSRQD